MSAMADQAADEEKKKQKLPEDFFFEGQLIAQAERKKDRKATSDASGD